MKDLRKYNKPGYRISLTCFYADGRPPYEDAPSGDPIFATKEAAFTYAVLLANREADGLNGEDGTAPEPGVHFGVPEDDEYQKGNSVRVEYYYDNEEETRVVTNYTIEQINVVVVEEEK